MENSCVAVHKDNHAPEFNKSDVDHRAEQLIRFGMQQALQGDRPAEPSFSMNRQNNEQREPPHLNPPDHVRLQPFGSFTEFLGGITNSAHYLHLANTIMTGGMDRQIREGGQISTNNLPPFMGAPPEFISNSNSMKQVVTGSSKNDIFPANPIYTNNNNSQPKGFVQPVSQTKCSDSTTPLPDSSNQIYNGASTSASASASPIRRPSSIASSSTSLSNCEYHEPGKPYNCSFCDKQFLMKGSLDRHIGYHTDKTSSNCCTLCEQKFCSKGSLQNHMLLHNDLKPYECTDCDKSFRMRSYLEVHTRTHTKEKPYACDVCFKAFAQRSSLATHMRMHTGIKPYTCEICFKSFTVKHYLTVHMRSHSGEKPFTCEVCSKCFSQKSSLTIHARLHSGEKPYACDICEKRFIAKSYLESHLKTHDVVKDFICRYCGKGFKQRSSMFVHMKKHNTAKPENAVE